MKMALKEFFTSNKKRTGLLLSAIVILSGVIPLIIFTFFADPAHPYTITQATLITEDNTPIKAHIYTPQNMTGNHPGIIIGHGFTGNSGHMQLLSIEFVKREFVVVNLNFRGHGNSGGILPSFLDPNTVNWLELDVLSGIEYLRDLGNINQIGLLGHSMGSMTVLKVSEDYMDDINATVALGMAVGFEIGLGNLTGPLLECNLSKISNLLIANGRLEQMFGLEISLNSVKEFTNLTSVEPETQYGYFEYGNACKYVMGKGEHLFEPLDAHIINESVAWFELAFYGTIRWPITTTSTISQICFLISLLGIIAICFVAILYLHNYLWKNQPTDLQKNLVKDTSLFKLFYFYIFATVIGVLLLLPLAILFAEITPVAMGQLLYAILVGNAIGTLIMYYFIIRKTENLGFKDILSKIKARCSKNYWRSALYGLMTATLLAFAIASVANWTTVITIPTLREYGTIFGLAILFFPWMLIKEFYFRTVQGQLQATNRFKEYFTMVGIGFLMDSLLFIPAMLFCWGRSELIGFLALALTVVLIYSLIQQILATWVYMYSGRNILGSTIFLCLFYAWMIIGFYPFGLPLF